MLPPSFPDVSSTRPSGSFSTTRPCTGALRPEQKPTHNRRDGQAQSLSRSVERLLLTGKQPSISNAWQQIKSNPGRALQVAEQQLTHSHDIERHSDALRLKARALCELKRYRQCLSFINALPRKLQIDKGLCLSKGRSLQELGHQTEALDVLTELYDSYATNPKDEKTYGLALVRALQEDGGPTKLQEGLKILKQMRRHRANNRENTPCQDKQIELALAIHLQQMGGKENMQSALAIFSGLADNVKGRMSPCDKDILLTVGRHLQFMGGVENREQALAIFRQMRQHASGSGGHTPCNDKTIELALGRLLQQLGGDKNLHEALCIFTRLRREAADGQPDTPCDDTAIELALGKCLEEFEGAANLQEALRIFTRLRTKATGGQPDTPCDDKSIELALARHLQRLGGAANLQEAVDILTRLRTQAAGGLADTPCEDTTIELTLGRLLQQLGGDNNLQAALDIFTQLRRRAASGLSDTPCEDTTVELTLGRHLQLLGGDKNLQAALDIFTRLRRRAAGGKPDTACDNKEIELALGRHLQLRGGSVNLQAALAIFTRLRSQAAAQKNTHCDGREVELALANCLIWMGRWQAYDALGLPTDPSVHYTIDLCHSIRYFRELIEHTSNMNDSASLLGLATWYACQAVQKSDYRDAGSFSQLAHCCRAISSLPLGYLCQFGIEQSKDEIDSWERLFFDEARRLAPNRTDERTCEQWRVQESAWLRAAEQMTATPTPATLQL